MPTVQEQRQDDGYIARGGGQGIRTNEVGLWLGTGTLEHGWPDDGSLILGDTATEQGQGTSFWLRMVLGYFEEEFLDVELAYARWSAISFWFFSFPVTSRGDIEGHTRNQMSFAAD